MLILHGSVLFSKNKNTYLICPRWAESNKKLIIVFCLPLPSSRLTEPSLHYTDPAQARAKYPGNTKWKQDQGSFVPKLGKSE